MRFPVLEELEIDYSDWDTDPAAFIDRMYKKSQELLKLLEENKTTSDYEDEFKNNALKNDSAKEKAKHILQQINDLILHEDEEVIVHVINGLHDTISMANGAIFSASQKSVIGKLTKFHIHKLYTDLRTTYDKYVAFGALVIPNFPPKVKIPMIKAKSGNYNPKGRELPLYKYIIDGDTENPITSPFRAAALLGVTINRWADLHDMVEAGQFGDRVQLEVW